MMTLRSSARLLVVVALIGCGGGGASAPGPAPSSSPAPLLSPVTRASGLAMELALLQLRISRYLGLIVRPGVGTTLLPPVQPAAVCNAATATATSATLDYTSVNETAITAFYPAGDATCSQAPGAVLEMYYPNVAAPTASSPVTGSGYLAFFAPDGLPGSVVGAAVTFDIVKAAIYARTDGAANIDTELDEYSALGIPAGIVQPAAGTFPATLPPPFPLPYVSQFRISQTDIAVVENGTGMLDVGAISVASGSYYGAQSNATLHVTGPAAGGVFTVTAPAQTASTAFDVEFVNIAQTDPALGSGKTAYGFAPISTQGFSDQNYGIAPTSTTSYRLDGSVVATSQDFTDSVNGVNVTVQGTGSGNVANTFTLTATDLLRNAAATSPSPISLDAFGDGAAPFAFALDPSAGTPSYVSSIQSFGVR